MSVFLCVSFLRFSQQPDRLQRERGRRVVVRAGRRQRHTRQQVLGQREAVAEVRRVPRVRGERNSRRLSDVGQVTCFIVIVVVVVVVAGGVNPNFSTVAAAQTQNACA